MFDQYQAVFKSLNSHGVKYLVIGGVAAIAYGSDRSTYDLDILIEPTLANATNLLKALAQVEFGTAHMTTPEKVLASEITKFRDWVVVDVQTSTPGITFEEAWNRRETGTAHGVTVVYVALDDLIASKVAAGRPKDLGDVAFLTSDSVSPRPLGQ